MRTIANPDVCRSLIRRLEGIRPDSLRRWGTLTPQEMLCHLGDATAMVLQTRPRLKPLPVRRRRVVKWMVLWLPVPWPHGVPTNPMHDPRAGGTRPTLFDADRTRVIANLEDIARAAAGALEPVHGLFGSMSVRDWQRWAYRHTDYHLRQFGV